LYARNFNPSSHESTDSIAVRSTHEDDPNLLPTFKNDFNHNSIGKTTRTLNQPPQPFDVIAHEVIETFLSREAKIGSQIDKFLTSANSGLVLFSHVLHDCYEFEGHTTTAIFDNITSTLDQLKISSDRITENLMEIVTWDRLPKQSAVRNSKLCKALVHPFKKIVGFLKGTQLW